MNGFTAIVEDGQGLVLRRIEVLVGDPWPTCVFMAVPGPSEWVRLEPDMPRPLGAAEFVLHNVMAVSGATRVATYRPASLAPSKSSRSFEDRVVQRARELADADGDEWGQAAYERHFDRAYREIGEAGP